MNIPKTATINLKIELDLNDYFTEDDKESLLTLSKNNQDRLNSYVMNVIRDNIETIINCNEISIKLND